MSGSLPLHMQVLVHLRNSLKARQAVLERRCGKGLRDIDYQRAVGGIKEIELTTAEVVELMRTGLAEVEDDQEGSNEQNGRTPRSTARRNQRTQ